MHDIVFPHINNGFNNFFLLSRNCFLSLLRAEWHSESEAAVARVRTQITHTRVFPKPGF